MPHLGFAEALVLAIVALLIVGPERLPGATRALGRLYARLMGHEPAELAPVVPADPWPNRGTLVALVAAVMVVVLWKTWA